MTEVVRIVFIVLVLATAAPAVWPTLRLWRKVVRDSEQLRVRGINSDITLSYEVLRRVSAHRFMTAAGLVGLAMNTWLVESALSRLVIALAIFGVIGAVNTMGAFADAADRRRAEGYVARRLIKDGQP